jgi:hypothetical protein
MGSNSKHALSKSHTQLVKGFMGQTTAFDSALVKSNILVMGTCELNGEVRYLNGQRGKGMFTFMVVMIQRISASSGRSSYGFGSASQFSHIA